MIFYIKQKLVAIRDKYTIKDESGTDCYKVWGRFTIPKKFVVENMEGKQILNIKGKIRLLDTFDVINASDKKIAEIKRKFTLFRKKFVINTDSGEYKLSGNVFAWNFNITKDDKIIATISKKVIAIKDSYTVEIFDPKDVELALSVVIVLDHVYHSKDTGMFNQ